MAAAWRWSMRVFAFLAMLFFAALMVVFVIVTVQHFGEKQYVTDNVSGLPPVYVITLVLVPCCAAFVGGFWMLFYDSFRKPEPAYNQPTSLPQPEQPGAFKRIRNFVYRHLSGQTGPTA
jgi:TRAP-type C4-dicarboxylate transport system permease small subunit